MFVYEVPESRMENNVRAGINSDPRGAVMLSSGGGGVINLLHIFCMTLMHEVHHGTIKFIRLFLKCCLGYTDYIPVTG